MRDGIRWQLRVAVGHCFGTALRATPILLAPRDDKLAVVMAMNGNQPGGGGSVPLLHPSSQNFASISAKILIPKGEVAS